MTARDRKRRIHALLSRWETIRFANSERECVEDFAAMIVDLEDRLAQYLAIREPAAPAEGLDVAAMQAALVAVIESNALDSDDLLWLDKMCRKAIGTDWPYLAAPADGLDVERLARALGEAMNLREIDRLGIARIVAREYAALTPEDDR